MTSYVNEEAARRGDENVSFSFGANWRKFLDQLSDPQIRDAQASLQASFGGAQMVGCTFLDLGCGSGLFSYAAAQLGADRVISVDVDPNALGCTQELRRKAPLAATWEIRQGSVLDPDFMTALPEADRVFSWGVLHHTGDMWGAIEQALTRVAPDGLACIALYTRPGRPRLHLALKRMYNRAPAALRPVMRSAYAAAVLSAELVIARRNPITYVRDYGKTGRGMNFWRDVEDWLGGLPWEYTSPEEVRLAVTSQGMTLVSTLTRGPGACNEYLVRRGR